MKQKHVMVLRVQTDIQSHRREGETGKLRRDGNTKRDRQKQRQVLFVGCLTSQQHASVSQGRICSDKFMCFHTEIEAADQTFYLTQSQYTDTGPTSPSADPIALGDWQGSHWSANFEVTGITRPGKIPSRAGFEPRIFRSRGGRLNYKTNNALPVKQNM